MNHPDLLLMLAILGLVLVLGVDWYLDHKRSHAAFMRSLKQYQDDWDHMDRDEDRH